MDENNKDREFHQHIPDIPCLKLWQHSRKLFLIEIKPADSTEKVKKMLFFSMEASERWKWQCLNHILYKGTVIGITQPPPTEGAWRALLSSLSKSDLDNYIVKRSKRPLLEEVSWSRLPCLICLPSTLAAKRWKRWWFSNIFAVDSNNPVLVGEPLNPRLKGIFVQDWGHIK